MNNVSFKYIFFLVIAVGLGVFIFYLFQAPHQIEMNQNAPVADIATPTPSITPDNSSAPALSNSPPGQGVVFEPIDRALERVTKKPFGIKISPKDSPVSPEKFSGYHTGVDFETFSDEQKNDVPVFAICEGKLALKKYATGYGGVAVQSCRIEDEDVTVVYGHLRLSSITRKLDEAIQGGEQIGVLGAGYGSETDGERKHLHLGIHKGKNIVLLGYVQAPEGLNQWIDAMTLLK